jgi:signal transduction histidine kinase
MSVTPWRPSLGTVLAVLAVAAACAGLLLATVEGLWSLPGASQIPVDAAVGISCPVIATVMLRARDRAPGVRLLARVLLVAGCCAGVTALSTALAATATTASGVASSMVLLQGSLWVPGFVPLVTLVPLLYPDGLLPGRAWRLLFSAGVVGTGLLTVGVGVYPQVFVGRAQLEPPIRSLEVAHVLAPAAAVLLVPAAVAGAVSLALRWRRSRGLPRRQVSVLIAAAAVLLVVTLLQGVLPGASGPMAQAVAVALVPVAIGVAVTRHRLYELDTAVRRALVAASLALCLAGTYLTLFALARLAVPIGSAVGTAVAAGVTGLVVQPLARRLSAGADRLYYGDRADPFAVSTRLAARLAEAGLDVTQVPLAVCETVTEALRLGGVEVWVGTGPSSTLAASSGETVVGGASYPLHHRGETVGLLVIGPRPGDAALEARDDRILTGIADQVAPAIAALNLHQELQLSRQSLVSAREQERQRLRRELHDGLGATLAVVRLQVESARAATSSPTVVPLLDSAAGGVVQAVAEVRSITDALRPPALDELGLPHALELLGARTQTTALSVAVSVAPLPELDPAVEVAAYRIAAEALANAARHSRASRAWVSVGASSGQLEVSVRDDGVGLGAPSSSSSPGRTGVGLVSMRTRAEEIGGSLDVRDAPGCGVVVRACLPIAVKVTT